MSLYSAATLGNFSSPVKRAVSDSGTGSGASPRRMQPPPLETRPPLASRSLAAAASTASSHSSSTSNSSVVHYGGIDRKGNINDDDDDLIVIADPTSALPGDSVTKTVRASLDQALDTLARDSTRASYSSGTGGSMVAIDSSADRLVPFDALPLPSAYAALLAAFVAFEVRIGQRCEAVMLISSMK